MFFDLPLGECPDQSVYLAAVLEEKERGNALDTVLRGCRRIVVCVQFGDLDSAGIFRGQLVQNRGQHPARAAPGCPAVHKDRPGEREHFVLKGPVCNFNRMIRHVSHGQRRAAPAADRSIKKPLHRDAILGSATVA